MKISGEKQLIVRDLMMNGLCQEKTKSLN